MQPTEPSTPNPVPPADPAPAPTPASVDPYPQPQQPIAPIEPLAASVPPAQAPIAQPIAEQWQTRQEYHTTQETAVAPRPASGITHKAAIALGVSVLVFILAVTTPLGDIASFGGGSGREMTARPLAGVAAVGVLVSYFVMVISGIVTSRTTGRTLSIVGLIIGGFLIANPIGLLMLFLIIGCNFTACQGS